jgi:hypothetical protein
MNNTRDAIPPFGAATGSACCFTCLRWIGKRKRDKAWCNQLFIATEGKDVCRMWVKRPNARSTPNASDQRPAQ